MRKRLFFWRCRRYSGRRLTGIANADNRIQERQVQEVLIGSYLKLGVWGNSAATGTPTAARLEPSLARPHPRTWIAVSPEAAAGRELDLSAEADAVGALCQVRPSSELELAGGRGPVWRWWNGRWSRSWPFTEICVAMSSRPRQLAPQSDCSRNRLRLCQYW